MILSDTLITAIVLISMLGSYLIRTMADVLNITRLSPNLPKTFSDVFDARRYETAQAYLKETTRAQLLQATVDMAVLLLFWFSGAFGILDLLVRKLSQNPIISGLLFIGILAGLKLVLSLPFSVFRTFVIEEKYGFNKTTMPVFIMDLIKTVLLSLVLGGLLLSVILWFFNATGELAWAYCWVATTVFLIAVQYIVPTWIMPLFNRFTPLENGALKTAIFEYARSIDFPLTQIFVMDGSKRSAKSNAFFAGFGKNKRIVLYDTLIKEQNTDELLAVLAHEMGHYKKKHIQRRLIMGICQMGVIFYLFSLILSHQGLFNAFFVAQPSVYAGLVFFSLLFSPIDMVLSLAMQAVSRRDEREADRFAATTTSTPGALVSALKKLSAHNLSNLTPHPVYVFLNYSHPPVLERIQRLNRIPKA
jgi:STE24 endopeptidase